MLGIGGPDTFIDDENRRRKFVLTIIFAVVSPALASFSLIELSKGNYPVAISDAIIAFIFLINIILMHVGNKIELVRLISLIVVIGMMSYDLTTGKANGQSFVWYYSFPPAAYYILGRSRGTVWVGISFLIAILALFIIRYYPYNYETSIRYIFTYFLVIAVSYALESARERFKEKLFKENEGLIKALDEVKTLKGLLPICANCKKIRNDDGYWEQVELYIRQRSDAEFSHDICPVCAKELYGDILDEEDGNEDQQTERS